MNKLILILPFFGKLPSYFELFLNSCVKNENFVDFLIITDNDLKSYNNIKILNFSWNSFRSFVKSKFDYPICLENPYKLCDFRPSYGIIFKDYIEKYDYWGHCDCDLIWGDFKLLDPIISSKRYERIGYYGHLTIYRNNEKVNNYFNTLKAPDVLAFKEVCNSTKNFAFDEFSGMNKLFDYNKLTNCKTRLFDDIIFYSTNFFSRRHFINENNNYSLKHSTPIFFHFDRGNLYRYVYIKNNWLKDESLYVHFQKRNMIMNNDDKNNFLIFPDQFINYSDFSTLNLKKLSKYKLIDYKYYKFLGMSIIKKFIKRFINR